MERFGLLYQTLWEEVKEEVGSRSLSVAGSEGAKETPSPVGAPASRLWTPGRERAEPLGKRVHPVSPHETVHTQGPVS